MRKDYRFFKLTRIPDIEMIDEYFVRDIPENIFERSDDFEMEMIQVTLLFDVSMRTRVFEKFEEEDIQIKEEGIYVYTEMPNNDLLDSYILSCGDKVKVITPDVVRTRIIEKAKKLLEKYNI
ncbi:putative DNA-binding transcriptional regulator YafY [Breznakia sp. PH1-1]|nr:putative DNA-binding transcriptional regulator YafY [Breznakia sp. PH1-1]MDH6404721.1 putative DNA-binding transcriptional regulator YafY [Breznakia sp. PF1-11]MDH6412431.1 putative DNA-binding transcriptional regulator YafY [Breznakia sp. PFB1-11]MDH6414796.1 putative DNA-binding transcriptional regulator YafY [Breznakia sp. PFB1-14]MDH6417102.1 putative DNA-binding transcriptional regulator YafY [Breznakia sp. PFB1-4]MDH6419464.1 putative DNA-binding transcriptional regulator YafY [Brezna